MEELQYDENGQVILPQPDDIPGKDRDHAAGAYIMMFASQYFPLPFANLIAALIYHLVSRKKSRFIAFHTWQSLISQIPTTLISWGYVAAIIGTLVAYPAQEWGDRILGPLFLGALAFLIVWNILYIVFSIIAFRRAGRGRLYYLPLFGKLAYNKYFGTRALPASRAVYQPPVNRPPGAASPSANTSKEY
ncbi:MAG: DUF4870 domain-containing protein [Proteobacteria bacterium]|nr:DUF4870 domain-containing protein [Pseudomonadota bacterium]